MVCVWCHHSLALLRHRFGGTVVAVVVPPLVVLSQEPPARRDVDRQTHGSLEPGGAQTCDARFPAEIQTAPGGPEPGTRHMQRGASPLLRWPGALIRWAATGARLQQMATLGGAA